MTSTTSISPLQQALDELESSILDGTSAMRALADIYREGSLKTNPNAAEETARAYLASADKLRRRFEGAAAAIRASLPAPAAAAKAADLAATYPWAGRDVTAALAPPQGAWIVGAFSFMQEVATARLPDRPIEQIDQREQRLAETVDRTRGRAADILATVPTVDRVGQFAVWIHEDVLPFLRDLAAGSLAEAVRIDEDQKRAAAAAEFGASLPIAVDIASPGRCNAWSYPGHASWEPHLPSKADGRRCALNAGHAGDHELSGPWTAIWQSVKSEAEQAQTDRRVAHELAVIAARRLVGDVKNAHTWMLQSDLKRMAEVVLAYAGEGPATAVVDARYHAQTVVPPAPRIPIGGAEIIYEAPRAPLELTPATGEENRQEALRLAVDDMRNAIMALRLEVDGSIADDILRRFDRVLVRYSQRHPTAELVGLRFFHDNVTARAKGALAKKDLEERRYLFEHLCADVTRDGGAYLMKPPTGFGPSFNLLDEAIGELRDKVVRKAEGLVSRGVHRRKTKEQIERGDLELLISDWVALCELAGAVANYQTARDAKAASTKGPTT